ncbi:FtsX-like permease family protein [Pseudobythopirellula maris]|uniref:FtsX-like permease family protein n=1 Tax=Pseudobythopirellula maris TaxID=2527991 RepID=A0A5C5ZJR7_9BACT|nr:ABC transporter permease [Pseudobythopirellula maris]TWT87287.1 FtsX-like permease family protein [Pseudobythopirellula maris]
MTPWRYALRSLWQFRRSNTAVALGVATAAAVLTGALVVGDSVRGSLRDLTLQRLGRVDHAVVARQPFRAALADELVATEGFDARFDGAAPVLLLQASLTSRQDGQTRRANDVQIVGCDERFWAFDPRGDEQRGQGVRLTPAVAEELGAAAGDEIMLRLPTVEALPADSPLGEKTDTTVGRRMAIDGIIAAEGIARFSLAPTQLAPRTVFLPLERLQELLDQQGKANALLIAAEEPTDQPATVWLEQNLKPQLADYGLSVDTPRAGLLQLESNQLVLPEAVVDAARTVFADSEPQPVVTYLANSILVGDRSTPYSTVAGVDSVAGIGPLLGDDGEPIVLADDQVAINRWTADDLGAAIGDRVTIRYYRPESTHGELVEAEPVTLTLSAIVGLTDAEGEPTAAADPRLTPRLEGVTDAASINDWDLPFELVETIRTQDEDYWDDHSTTPKAFLSHALAERLWTTRWGTDSLLRVASDEPATAAGERLRAAINPKDLGLTPTPVKRQGLAAASGATPFDVLFLLFSMFLIASAVMLITLLFRLAIDSRAREVGLLAAIGFQESTTRHLLLREALVVAAIGSAVGVAAGVGYAWLMLYGLRTVWIDAVVTPFLELHATPRSLAIGLVAGVAIAWLTIRRTLGKVVAAPPRALLAGQSPGATAPTRHATRRGLWLRLVLLAGAIACGVAGAGLRGEAQAGAFFGSGALLLAAVVWSIHALLGRRGPTPAAFGMRHLVLRNISRNPGRTTLSLALTAAASFMILATGAFHLPPTDEGTGGFELVAEAAAPVHFDLGSPEGRLELGFSTKDEALIERFRVFPLRVHDGEDASCLNLYQTTQPRVLGAPPALVERGGFVWADSAAPDGQNPWDLLEAGPDAEGAYPVALDFNTAMYGLKLYGGVGSTLTIRDAADQPVTLRVVGLLKNSMLQGDLLLGEKNFLDLFPETAGSRFFLIESRDSADDRVVGELADLLEDRLSDNGLDAEPARERLAGFLAVQNTYLATFQSLGGLGLVLGAVGLAVAQMRNLSERRGELALMRSAGFTTGKLQWMVRSENVQVLFLGLVAGSLAAAVALAPVALSQGASLPWRSILGLMGAVLLTGTVTGYLASAAALRAPITPALRGD